MLSSVVHPCQDWYSATVLLHALHCSAHCHVSWHTLQAVIEPTCSAYSLLKADWAQSDSTATLPCFPLACVHGYCCQHPASAALVCVICCSVAALTFNENPLYCCVQRAQAGANVVTTVLDVCDNAAQERAFQQHMHRYRGQALHNCSGHNIVLASSLSHSNRGTQVTALQCTIQHAAGAAPCLCSCKPHTTTCTLAHSPKTTLSFVTTAVQLLLLQCYCTCCWSLHNVQTCQLLGD